MLLQQLPVLPLPLLSQPLLPLLELERLSCLQQAELSNVRSQ